MATRLQLDVVERPPHRHRARWLQTNRLVCASLHEHAVGAHDVGVVGVRSSQVKM
jgi:hypothetical protein